MILRHFKVAIILVAVLMIVSIGAKAVGALQPANPALRGFTEGCADLPKPCWYGIVPGITTLEQAQAQIIDLGYGLVQETQDTSYFYKDDPDGCPRIILFYPDDNQESFSLHLYQCNHLSVGHSIQLGTFKHILKTSPGDYNITVDDFYTITIHPCSGYTLRCTVDFSPDISITTLHFSKSESNEQRGRQIRRAMARLCRPLALLPTRTQRDRLPAMTPFYLKCIVPCLVILLVLAILARTIGMLQPPNPALRGFVEGCEEQPQPCWYGVVPDKIIPNDTLTRLGRYRVEIPGNPGAPLIYGKSVTNCNVDITMKDDGQEVDFFFLEGNCNLQLGDVLTTLGRPDFVNQADLRSNLPPMLIYQDGTRIWTDECCHFSLYSRVQQMFLTSFAVTGSPPPKWRGFVPNWRYCNLEPVLIACTP